MIRNRIKKIIIVCVVLSMLFSLNTGISMVIAQNAPIIILNDSAAWVGDMTKMDTVGNQTTITGETALVYSGLNIVNELVAFDLSTNVSDGWVGLRFRSNLPGNAPWDNTTGYFFLLRSSSYQIMRQNGLEVITGGSYPNNLNIADGSDRKIVAGVYDSNDGNSVNIYLKIGENIVVEFADNDKDKMTKGSSVFSIYQYGNTQSVITVAENAESTLGGIVDRNLPVVNETLDMDDSWFINNIVGMGRDGGNYAYIENDADTITLRGRGGATSNIYKAANKYSFNVSLEIVENDSGAEYMNQSGVVLFRKQDRSSPYGKNSYGIRFSLNGRISLVRYDNDNARIFPAYETGVDFSQPQKITVEIYGDISSADWVSEIYIFVGDSNKAYKYRDRGYNPNLEPPGFFGILNIEPNVNTSVSNVKYSGDEMVYFGYEKLYPVYFAEFINESDKKFVRWNWRTDNYIYSHAVITTKNGHVLGKVKYPHNEFHHTELDKYDKLYVSAVDADGVRADAIEVDLTEDIESLKANTVEKIVINQTSGYAGFFTQDTGEPFIVNGVNYVPIRFGDHGTFEPEFGLIPAKYDPYATEALMRTLKRNGYNFVRVFVIPGGRRAENLGMGGIFDKTEGLYIPYMESFVDFLTRANKYGIYVLPNFAGNEMVSNQFFREISNNTSQQTILFSNAGINAKAQYMKWFLEYIKNRNPEIMGSLFAMSVQNEFAYYANRPPFNQTQGVYTFLDGTQYNMSVDDDRRSLAVAAINNYYSELKKAINDVVPGMLLTEGTFTMLAVGKDYNSAYGIRQVNNDLRVPMSGLELLRTDIDFLDMHVYRYGQKGTAHEVFERNFKNMLLDTTEAQDLMKEKPIILGEYGSFSTDVEEMTIEEGMAFSKGLLDSALARGFAGHAYWTIDTFEQTNIWNLMWENSKYLPYMSLLNPDGTASENWESEDYLLTQSFTYQSKSMTTSILNSGFVNTIKNLNTGISDKIFGNDTQPGSSKTVIWVIIAVVTLLGISFAGIIYKKKEKVK